ncbi:MAG: UDP-N-acetylmuramoyl-L-alanine--D-glutamate ligase [Lachnospiraceae bacterium]|nr:UDP-N-acetylmuramoyl-L-alanine--D-glutamate ligase [Lachnospiraceae bacterium]
MKGKILVVGYGKSGIAACFLLKEKGEDPILFDSDESKDKESVREKLKPHDDITLITGSVPKDIEDSVEMLVLSPGVPLDSDIALHYKNKGIKLSGEIELAYSYEKGSLLAVTGTNGKTTTTSLLGKIMQDYNHNSFIVGNIGNPYTSEVLKTNDTSVTVAEISSFQLETIDKFKPKVSSILNITPDHLNRHHTMENYIREKEKITINQDMNDHCILNYDDPILRDFGEAVKKKVRVHYFSSREELSEGYFYKDEYIYKALAGKKEKLLHKDELKIIGVHNMENAMAAIAMADAFLVPMENILDSVRSFTAVAHRIEFIKEVDGVRYYNDSKGTNVDAAIKGIEAMDRKTCLIGGGYDKGAEYDEWIDAFGGKVKKLVLIGQTREKIAECARRKGFTDIEFADSLEEAVEICRKNSVKGEAVLLSPACASWGMFDNYEQRGDMFREIVNSL